ncbi:MAG: efflux RND transporter permease subunit [Sulfuritalea sp.]|nr:efflux RND transporter permease subunit [Sulfuritalea sp.]
MNDAPVSLLRRFLRIGAEHPAWGLAFLLAVSLAAAFGLPRLTVDTGFEPLMVKDAPDHQAYLHVAREFGSDNRTFIYLRDEQLWTPAKLRALEQLHDELRQLPFVERIDDLFTSPTVRSIEGQLNAQPLLGTAPTEAQDAERARAAVIDDPLAARNLVSADGKSIAIGLSIRESARASAGRDVYETLERVLTHARGQFPSLVQVGPPRIEAEIRQGLIHDLSLLAPLSALLLAIVVFGFCRNALAAAMPLVVGAISLLWTFGMMGFAGIPLSLLSAMLPVLVVATASIEIVRMISACHEDPPPGADHGRSVDFMVRNLGAPAVLTGLAMTLGFAGNAVAGIAIIRDFGLAAAFAILANGLITVLLIPALHAALGRGGGTAQDVSAWCRLSAWAARAVGLAHHRWALMALALAAAIGAGLALQAPSLRISHDPQSLFQADGALLRTTERMHEELAGVKVFYITLDANTEGAFRDPANLQRLAEIQAFIAKQQVFDRSLSLADIVSQANQQAAGGRPEAYRVPTTRKATGQYLLLHRSQDIAPYVSHDFRRATIVVRHNVRDSSTLNRHIGELRTAVAHYAGPAMATSITGEGLLINAAADRLPKTQAMVIGAMLVLVLIVMSLMFTSVKGGVIALVPSAVLILIILAAMRVLEIPLDMGTALVAVLAIGVAVEGTGHLFSRYADLCRNASDYDAAMIDTVKSEAAPLIAVGLALAAGFAVLLLSDFAPIARFGAQAAAAMLLSIFVNLLITPLVMARIRLVGLYEVLAMSMQREALEGCPLFVGLTSYQIRKTILISELREYRDGARLIEQGTVGRSMYLVVSGQIEVSRHDGAALQRLALLGPGDVFGEIGFVHETYRTADVRALGAVSVLRFDHERLKRDLMLFPHIMAKLNFNISGILGRRLAELVETQQAHRQAPPPPAVVEQDG